MTAVEIYPGNFIKNVLLSFEKYSIQNIVGLGAWTSALKEGGFKRVIALEPQTTYHHWLEVRSCIKRLKRSQVDNRDTIGNESRV
jgi:hypothetical protein